MMPTVAFFRFLVPGEPIGKARGRAFHNGRSIVVRTPTKTRSWEHDCADVAAYRSLEHRWPRAYAAPVAVTIDAVFQRPQDRMRKTDPTGRMVRERGKVDADNVAKAVLDGLQKSGAIRNDSQVADLRVRLFWSAEDEGPCVDVLVEALSTPAP